MLSSTVSLRKTDASGAGSRGERARTVHRQRGQLAVVEQSASSHGMSPTICRRRSSWQRRSGRAGPRPRPSGPRATGLTRPSATLYCLPSDSALSRLIASVPPASVVRRSLGVRLGAGLVPGSRLIVIDAAGVRAAGVRGDPAASRCRHERGAADQVDAVGQPGVRRRAADAQPARRTRSTSRGPLPAAGFPSPAARIRPASRGSAPLRSCCRGNSPWHRTDVSLPSAR